VTPILETQHLKLREFSRDDLDDLAAMVADEEQMRFYPRPKTRDEASAWISRNLGSGLPRFALDARFVRVESDGSRLEVSQALAERS